MATLNYLKLSEATKKWGCNEKNWELDSQMLINDGWLLVQPCIPNQNHQTSIFWGSNHAICIDIAGIHHDETLNSQVSGRHAFGTEVAEGNLSVIFDSSPGWLSWGHMFFFHGCGYEERVDSCVIIDQSWHIMAGVAWRSNFQTSVKMYQECSHFRSGQMLNDGTHYCMFSRLEPHIKLKHT